MNDMKKWHFSKKKSGGICDQILSAFSSKLELQLRVQAPVCILKIHHNTHNLWNWRKNKIKTSIAWKLTE